MRRAHLTVGLSSHRVETLAYAEPLMAEHDLVLLEEPSDELFQAMLDDEIAIDEYVDEIAPAFPSFARSSCAVWRRLHQSGVRMVQIDPFMEELTRIHEGFEQGGKPVDIPAGTVRRAVYDAEHQWTNAIIPFYANAARASFDEVVDATLRFARADAVRGRLRDEMRVAAVLMAARTAAKVYVEAGYLHHWFWLELRRRLLPYTEVRPVWLLEPVVRPRIGQRQVLSPGDKLTLSYTFRPDREPHRARLLAARSLIYVKIALKEEAQPDEDPHPHTTDELAATELVAGLSYEQCHELYGTIHDRPQPVARARVLDYWSRQGTPAS